MDTGSIIQVKRGVTMDLRAETESVHSSEITPV